jgi:hypothetical protein
VAQVFAGFVCGYIMALVGAPLLALNLVRLRTSSATVSRLMPQGTSMVALTVVLHGVLIIGCTGAGLLLGLLLYAMRHADGALGSPNLPFTLFVFGATVAAFAPAVFLAERFRQQVLAAAAVVLLLFGWLMPYLAEWSTFSST